MRGNKGNTQRACLGLSALSVAAALSCGNAQASFLDYNDGKVLATPGVSMADGAGGGGAVPWAAITGYETRDGINGDVHMTYAYLPNYSLDSVGAAVGFYDRLELSYAYDVLPTGSTFNTLGLLSSVLGGAVSNNSLSGSALSLAESALGLTSAQSPSTGNTQLIPGVDAFNTTIKMHVFGAKVRLIGEAIYDSDNLIPQVAIGGFYKANENKALIETLGGRKAKDFEAYICATKIFFPISTLVDINLRYSGANQIGLTGFGNATGEHRKIRPEVSIAYLLAKNTALGGEYAQHGHNQDGNTANLNGISVSQLFANPTISGVLNGAGLGGLQNTLTQKESNWYDFFCAYFPNKNINLVFALLDLGNITFTPNQIGYYFSAQVSF